MTYYVYAHYKKGEVDIPFYVGKGRKRRAWQTNKRSEFWHNVVKKYGCDIRILYDDLSESDAFWIECKLIGMFGRADKGLGPLVNHTDGGDGASGNIQSPELKKQKSEKMKGRKYDENRRKNVSEGMKGNANGSGERSAEAKRNMSLSQMGNKKRLGIPQTEYNIRRSKEAHSKTWNVTLPNGENIKVFCLLDFCKDHDIGYRSMRRTNETKKPFKGYLAEQLG
jgi:hypothetical protein